MREFRMVQVSKCKILALLSVICALSLIWLNGEASALPIMNGGFETGDIDQWTELPIHWEGSYTQGTASVVTTATNEDGDTITPTEGDYMAMITSTDTLSQVMTWYPGDTISFDYYLLWTDSSGHGPRLNFDLFYGITTYTDVELSNCELGVTLGSGNPLQSQGPIGSTYDPVTGWYSYSYTFTEYSGIGTLVFSNAIQPWDIGETSLLVDNVRITGPRPVPEPATMLLLCTGLAGLAGFRMKFRKS